MIYQRAIHPNLIAVVSTSFDDSPDFALQEIRRSGTQIIFGFFGPSNARKVLCRVRIQLSVYISVSDNTIYSRV